MISRDFTVRVEPQGRTIVAREDRPVLETALQAGLNLPRSCRSGHCGSCRARLISGSIHYANGEPLGLMPEDVAEGYVLLCQALPRSDLTIDVRMIADVGDVEIKTLPCRVARLEKLGSSLTRMVLRLPSVERLPVRPGQRVELLLEGGRRVRYAPVYPAPDERTIEIRTAQLPDVALQEGDLLRIEGPFDP